MSAVRLRVVRDEDGFTVLEVLVSVVLISIVMIALGTFLTATTSVLGVQRDRQAAVQFADDAMELVRAKGAAVVNGRVSGNASTVAPGADLSGMNEFDVVPQTQPPTTPAVPLALARAAAGVSYTQYVYVGTCFAPAINGGAMSCTRSTGTVGYYRVVVAETWPSRRCTGGTCSYVTATLISCGMWTSATPCDPTEPVFRYTP